jgi:antitoxin MazE
MQTISKWGNSLAVRIPATLAERAGFAEGTAVEFEVQRGKLVVTRIHERYDLKDLVDRITPANRHELADWGKPAGKEVW